jgi:hypothetical protein
MDWKLLLGSSVVGAVVGAILKAIWDRRTDKKGPKTEMRAEAYRDFIVYVVRMANGQPAAPNDGDFHEIVARLLLFGESAVVNAAAQLVKQKSLASRQAQQDLGLVVQEMRKSLLTGHSSTVVESALVLANAKPWA